jgi:hypothetical protein
MTATGKDLTAQWTSSTASCTPRERAGRPDPGNDPEVTLIVPAR